MKKILVCGGHLSPALALVDSLQNKHIKIIFLGRKKVTEGNANLSAEYRQIRDYNVNFINVITGRLQRRFGKTTIPSLLKIPIGFIQTFLVILISRPALVISFGGSLSFPAVFSAWLLGIDTITHEQSLIPGISNRLNSFFVTKVYLTWPNSQKYFPENKSRVIGNLEVATAAKLDDKKLENLLKTKKPILLVAGGNQGSHFINTLIFDNIGSLKDYNIIHQIGTANFQNDHEKAKKIKTSNYVYYDFIPAKIFARILKKANFIISRSGANTVWQIASNSKIAVLIPLPYSASREQHANAQILQDAGSAIVLEQPQSSFAKLQKALESLKSNSKSMHINAQKFSKQLPKLATEALAREILSV